MSKLGYKLEQLKDTLGASRVLREAGVTERLVVDGLAYQKLRREQVDAAIPGLLDSVVRSANWEAGVS